MAQTSTMMEPNGENKRQEMHDIGTTRFEHQYKSVLAHQVWQPMPFWTSITAITRARKTARTTAPIQSRDTSPTTALSR
eukprot:5896210-Pleurochrysis_carterae.AAC.2